MLWYGWVILIVAALVFWVLVGIRLWSQGRSLFHELGRFSKAFDEWQPVPEPAESKPATILDDALLHEQLAQYRDRKTVKVQRKTRRWEARWGAWLQD